MNATPPQLRTARQGRPAWISADAMSITRLEWSKKVALTLLQTASSNSTIVRRALAVYQSHLESLITHPAPNRLAAERKAISACNRGDTRSVPEADLTTAATSGQPMPTLTHLMTRKPSVSMSEFMQADLKRWADEEKADARAKRNAPPWKVEP